MRTSKSIWVLAMIAGMLCLSRATQATTPCVNPTGSGGCYSTIQAAITAAAAGDTVTVMPGMYHQAVLVNKAIWLIAVAGHENTVINPDTGAGITLTTGSSGSHIIGFTIEAPSSWGVVISAANLSIWVDNCVIRNCQFHGIGQGYYSGCFLRASNNVAYNNAYGIGISQGNAYLYSNILLNNHHAGIAIDPRFAACTNEYNVLWGNTPNYQDMPAGTYDKICNPNFVDPIALNFHLTPGSCAIDAGRQGLSYLDCDGTPNDAGVYGGPYAYCGPGPVVTKLQVVPAVVVKGETFTIQATGATR